VVGRGHNHGKWAAIFPPTKEKEEDDKQTIFKLIDKMLTNKKFKDFFQKNVAAL